jgi:hypothetical protein
MADHPRDRDDGLAGALAIHLSFYCVAAACFGLILYALMQPSRSDNPGLAAYKPPPGTALTHVPSMPDDQTGAPALTMLPEAETTGRAAHEPPQGAERSIADAQPQAASPPPRPPRPKSRPRREVSATPAARASACIPGYDSSGAQTRPC